MATPRTGRPPVSRPWRSALLALLLAGLTAGGCTRDDQQPGGPAVRMALNWFPEAEHGGFYAAQVHGHYAAAAVAVEILGGGPDAPVIQRVATGDVTFGVTNADDVLFARAQGAPVVALMAPYQVNPRCIMVHAAAGIDSIGAIRDMTLAMSQRPAFAHYLRFRYPFPGVTIVPYPGNVTQFLRDPRYAQQGYVFSEPFVARQQGAEPRALLVADVGFNPYASVLVTSEQTMARQPELVRAVVQASVKGWRHYLEAPDSTNARIHQLNPEMGLQILAYGAAESVPLVLDSVARTHGLGYMSLERWETLAAQMVAAGMLAPQAVDPAAAFTPRFWAP